GGLAAPTPATAAFCLRGFVPRASRLRSRTRTTLSCGCFGRRRAFASGSATTTAAAGAGGCAGNRSDQLALAVEDVEREVLCRLLQQVRNRCAAGGPNRVARREEIEVARRRHRGTRLPDRGDIVEDVEATPVRGDGDVVRLNRDVGDLRIRQVQRERLPFVAIVERHVEPVLC